MKKLPEEVRDWLRFAAEDLRSAEVLLQEGIYNQACFHSQQCIEKMLKALLISRGRHLPKIHDLNELFEKCIQSESLSLLAFREKVSILSLYYVPTRYPDAAVGSLPDRLPHKEDAKEALSIARVLYEKLQKEIS